MKSKNKKINKNKEEKFSFSRSVYNKDNFKEFCKLEIDCNLKSVHKNDLPHEISDETCEFIDIFRRKTANEKTEWEFYIDYENNEIIHCLHGKETNVKDWIHSGLMENRKILSIHNHPKGTYSAPSAKNFEILDHEFEDYEIICAEKEFWILKAKGSFDAEWICDVKKEIYRIFKKCDNLEGVPTEKIPFTDSNKLYENELKIFINNLKSNISLTKKEYG